MAGGWRYLVSKRFQFYSCHVDHVDDADEGIEFARLHGGKQPSGSFCMFLCATSLVICLLQFCREAWDRVAEWHQSYSCGIVWGCHYSWYFAYFAIVGEDLQEHLHRFGDWMRLECLSICFERVAWKCCPRPNQAMSLFSFLQGTAARSGNCCIFSLISLLAWLQSFQHISHVSMRFNASNLWIGWQVRLPGGELEDALVPCDSAQGVVPLAILASWKYWGCFVLFEFERLKVVCFIKSVCPFLLICNDFCKCRSWNTPHLQSFWS